MLALMRQEKQTAAKFLQMCSGIKKQPLICVQQLIPLASWAKVNRWQVMVGREPEMTLKIFISVIFLMSLVKLGFSAEDPCHQATNWSAPVEHPIALMCDNGKKMCVNMANSPGSCDRVQFDVANNGEAAPVSCAKAYSDCMSKN